MAVANLALNQSKPIAHFDRPQTIYIKNYGPGNVRVAPTKDELDTTISVPPGGVQDGRVLAVADGWQQMFWEGDMWAIADNPANTSLVWIAPGYEFWINRQVVSPDSTVSVAPVPGSLVSV